MGWRSCQSARHRQKKCPKIKSENGEQPRNPSRLGHPPPPPRQTKVSLGSDVTFGVISFLVPSPSGKTATASPSRLRLQRPIRAQMTRGPPERRWRRACWLSCARRTATLLTWRRCVRACGLLGTSAAAFCPLQRFGHTPFSHIPPFFFLHFFRTCLESDFWGSICR